MIRKIIPIFILSLAIVLGTSGKTLAAAPTLSFSPAQIYQGDPFMVRIVGVSDAASVKKLTFNDKKIVHFNYQAEVAALMGVDLREKTGTYNLVAELSDGTVLKKSVEVNERKITEIPLGIPEKLGGNTKASEDKLIATLAAEKKVLSNLRTAKAPLWTQNFVAPLAQIFVTNSYGLSRKTGGYSIGHKGVDYRAALGTPVMAINRGIVRKVVTLRDHGKTIVVDHGGGVMSFYLHLSKYKVKVGDVVSRGQIIALSGDTGYTVGPHLHLSVEINKIAIDPVKFLALFP